MKISGGKPGTRTSDSAKEKEPHKHPELGGKNPAYKSGKMPAALTLPVDATHRNLRPEILGREQALRRGDKPESLRSESRAPKAIFRTSARSPAEDLLPSATIST